MLDANIYADLLSFCSPAHLPRPWRRFGKDSDLWQPPADEAAAWAALSQKYSADQLIRSGVACRAAAREPILNPLLLSSFRNGIRRFAPLADVAPPPAADTREAQGLDPFPPANLLVPLRASPSDAPFDLLANDGTARGQLPLFASARDGRIGNGIQQYGLLFVVFAPADLAALRAVDLPVSSATGLDAFTPQSLEEVRAVLGCATATGDAPPRPSHRPVSTVPQLILAGWSVGRLASDRPDGVDAVTRSLTQLGAGLGIDLRAVLLWEPRQAEIQRIASGVAHGRRTDVVQAILSSLDRSVRPLAPLEGTAAPRGDLLALRARLRESLGRPTGSAAQRRRRFREFERAVEGLFVEPLLKRASAEPDPVRRSRFAALAAVNRLLHPSVEIYLAHLEREIIGSGPGNAGAALETRELGKLFDVLLRLTLEAKR